jgi:hypothetical protein
MIPSSVDLYMLELVWRVRVIVFFERKANKRRAYVRLGYVHARIAFHNVMLSSAGKVPSVESTFSVMFQGRFTIPS